MDPQVRIDVQPSEEDATVSRPGDLELVKTKIGLENHADVDTSEAGPSFGGEWASTWGSPKLKENVEIGPVPAPMDTSEAGPSFGGEWCSPKLKENGEICPAPAPTDPSEAGPSHSEPWSRSKLKEPEEIGSITPLSSDTDNFFERFQPEILKFELYQAEASGNRESFYRLDCSHMLLQISPQGNTALHVAAQYKQSEMARAIIQHGGQSLLNSCNMNGDTPLHIAASVGCADTLLVLITHQHAELNVEITNEEGDTALHVAVRGAHLQVVRLLVEANLNWTRTENNVGESPLFLAVDKWHFDIARVIISASFEYSIKGRDSMNVLHAAIIRLGQGKLLPTKLVSRYLSKCCHKLGS